VYLEKVLFSSKACVDFAIHNSFKVKCAKNWYRDVSSCVLRTLKGFFMAKLAVDLDVNIVLYKYGFNGVAPFEIVMFGYTEIRYFACICLSKYAARQTQFFGEIQHFQRLMCV